MFCGKRCLPLANRYLSSTCQHVPTRGLSSQCIILKISSHSLNLQSLPPNFLASDLWKKNMNFVWDSMLPVDQFINTWRRYYPISVIKKEQHKRYISSRPSLPVHGIILPLMKQTLMEPQPCLFLHMSLLQWLDANLGISTLWLF